MKKKLLIVTLNDYIIYQPSILNLYDMLQPWFEVTIISVTPSFQTKKKDTSRNIIYLKPSFLLKQFYNKIDFLLPKLLKVIRPSYEYHFTYYNIYLPSLLKRELKKQLQPGQTVIAVDLPVLAVIQQLTKKAVHFLSLEIENRTGSVYRKIDPQRIKSVFVQSQMRYDYLFPGISLKTFLVQNAPVFSGKIPASHPRKDFIWAGSMQRVLAVTDCIDFFDTYPQYRLVLKGGGDRKTMTLIYKKYDHLIRDNRIKIDQQYLSTESFLDFIAGFRIGFCFYSWALINAQFNYRTAPSGKMFMYMAAGTPVIACRIPAFDFIEEFGAGVLIDDYEPKTIFDAVQRIEANYEQYSAQCYAVAAHFSFDKNVGPYIQYLVNDAG